MSSDFSCHLFPRPPHPSGRSLVVNHRADLSSASSAASDPTNISLQFTTTPHSHQNHSMAQVPSARDDGGCLPAARFSLWFPQYSGSLVPFRTRRFWCHSKIFHDFPLLKVPRCYHVPIMRYPCCLKHWYWPRPGQQPVRKEPGNCSGDSGTCILKLQDLRVIIGREHLLLDRTPIQAFRNKTCASTSKLAPVSLIEAARSVADFIRVSVTRQLTPGVFFSVGCLLAGRAEYYITTHTIRRVTYRQKRC